MQGSATSELVIVMSVYNGALYLSEQIESIRAQSVADWLLLVRDDGSVDGSVEIVQNYGAIDDRIRLILDDDGNLGAQVSFSKLISDALDINARYISFCDQDDVWLPDKLHVSMRRMKELESMHGPHVPTLVHTDLYIVDENLDVRCDSYMRFENIADPHHPCIASLLVQNYVVGCTVMVNAALASKARSIPRNVRMHDWWLAALAATIGSVSYVPQATIKYRQHGRNTLGAGGFLQLFNPFSEVWRTKLRKRPVLQRATYELADALETRVTSLELTGPGVSMFRECREILRQAHRWTRVKSAWRAGMNGHNWAATAIFYALLLTMPR